MFWCGTNLYRGVFAVLMTQTAAWITWRSWEATWGATGFLLLLRGKSGSGEYGLLPGALFVEGDME